MNIIKVNNTREFVTYCQKYIKGRTLDLGAGTAKYKNIIMEKSSSYTAFDMFSGPKIDIVGDINATGLPSSSFNTIICTQVLEHVPTPWLAAKEIERLLEKDGIAIVTTPFIQVSHADPHDYYRYTADGLAQIFSSAGLEIVEKGGYCRSWSVQFDFIKMLWFSPYRPPRRGSWTFLKYMMKLGSFLDRLATNDVMYGNSYVIGRKK